MCLLFPVKVRFCAPPPTHMHALTFLPTRLGLYDFLSVCLSVCLPVCLSVCIRVCVSMSSVCTAQWAFDLKVRVVECIRVYPLLAQHASVCTLGLLLARLYPWSLCAICCRMFPTIPPTVALFLLSVTPPITQQRCVVMPFSWHPFFSSVDVHCGLCRR